MICNSRRHRHPRRFFSCFIGWVIGFFSVPLIFVLFFLVTMKQDKERERQRQRETDGKGGSMVNLSCMNFKHCFRSLSYYFFASWFSSYVCTHQSDRRKTWYVMSRDMQAILLRKKQWRSLGILREYRFTQNYYEHPQSILSSEFSKSEALTAWLVCIFFSPNCSVQSY